MDTLEQRQKEKEILEKADNLINSLITSRSIDGEQQRWEWNVSVVKELMALFMEVFPEAINYLEVAVREMLRQKLADPVVWSNFPDLSANLEEIIMEGIRQYRGENDLLPFEPTEAVAVELPPPLPMLPANGVPANRVNGWPELPVEKEEISASAPPAPVVITAPSMDPLEWSLSVLFPECKMIPNYTKDGRSVLWYLPQARLAFDWEKPARGSSRRNRLFWKQHQISLVILSPEQATNHRAVQRQIWRQAPSF
ncbi:MAG: hypothetical protein GX295_00140 [Syntrophomonadaceae bacterium]|nr:hypothetical protein [Syntrophomonadaceae bacterium]